MRHFLHRAANPDGSIMVIAMMVLAIMTLIGIMGANTTINENFILRNGAFHKQNVNLVEAGVMEALQQVMNQQYPDDTQIELEESNAGESGTVAPWLNTDDDWESNGLDTKWYSRFPPTQLLDPDETSPNLNLKTPALAAAGGIESNALAARGEIDQGNLNVALVGWEPATSGGGSSIKSTSPVRRSGRILGEYYSEDYGMVRLEVGIERIF